MKLVSTTCLLLVLFCLCSANSLAVTGDSGNITTLYVDESGNVAIVLDNGFSNAVAAGECQTSNGFAGLTSAAPELKSAILAAKSSGAPVTVNISGCAANGAWFKVVSIYIK